MCKAIMEYWDEVFVPTCRWMKRHWKGFTLLSVLWYLGLYVYYFRPELPKMPKRKQKYATPDLETDEDLEDEVEDL